jgi:ABC-type transporter Mla MlaB component
MMRISELVEPGQPVRLRLEGRLVGPWVDELQRTCESLVERGDQVSLDLSGVSFADPDGIALVRALRRDRVAIVNCTPFLALQIEE